MPVFVSFELFVELAFYDMYHHQSWVAESLQVFYYLYLWSVCEFALPVVSLGGLLTESLQAFYECVILSVTVIVVFLQTKSVDQSELLPADRSD